MKYVKNKHMRNFQIYINSFNNYLKYIIDIQ
jgi:hypothetical protein